jgi:hypothetical protein
VYVNHQSELDIMQSTSGGTEMNCTLPILNSSGIDFGSEAPTPLGSGGKFYEDSRISGKIGAGMIHFSDTRDEESARPTRATSRPEQGESARSQSAERAAPVGLGDTRETERGARNKPWFACISRRNGTSESDGSDGDLDALQMRSSTCGWEIVRKMIVRLGLVRGEAEGQARSLRKLLKRMETRAESSAALAERSAYHLANRTAADRSEADLAGSEAYKFVHAQYGISLRLVLTNGWALGMKGKLLDAQRWQQLRRSMDREATRIDREWQARLAHR